MSKTTASLLGVIVGLATLGSARALPGVAADPSGTIPVSSTAAEQLDAHGAARAAESPSRTTGTVQLAQYHYGYGRPYYAPYRPPYPYYRRYGYFPHHHHYYPHYYPHYRHYGYYHRY